MHVNQPDCLNSGQITKQAITFGRFSARTAVYRMVAWQHPAVGGTVEGDFTNTLNNDRFFNKQ